MRQAGLSIGLVACAVAFASPASAQPVYEVRHAFELHPNTVQGPPLVGADGRLYATATYGGDHDLGVVFGVDADGSHFEVLHAFGGTDGQYPMGQLAQDADGWIYGSTYYGMGNAGTVFRMRPDGGGFAVLKALGPADSRQPSGGILLGPDGKLYGVSLLGGRADRGTVFRLNADGTGYEILHEFASGEGRWPQTLSWGPGSMLYGTTEYGGPLDYGTLFRLGTDGTGFETLRAFAGPDGRTPFASLLEGVDGRLYGATLYGGVGGGGTVFRLQPDGTGHEVLHSFATSAGGYSPTALAFGASGRLYGTTDGGGSATFGTVFSLDPDGSGFAVHRDLTRADGTYERRGLTRAPDGTLYGSAYRDGPGGGGTVFRLAADGTGFAVVCALRTTPNAPTDLILAADGRLYGATESSLFGMERDGTGFAFLQALDYSPTGTLVEGLSQGTDGRLYGTAFAGGPAGGGTVFRMNTDGTVFQIVHAFPGGAGGLAPVGGAVDGPGGWLYGATMGGGDADLGTLYRVRSDGSSFQVLRSFSADTGSRPRAAPTFGPGGKLYGTTSTGGFNGWGSVYRVDPDGAHFEVLRNLDGGVGGYSTAGLVVGPDGRLYGVTPSGGAHYGGTVFRLDPDGGHFEAIRHFDFVLDGCRRPTLTLAADGRLYGTSACGYQTTAASTSYRLGLDGGGYETLHAFDLPTGEQPETSLVDGGSGTFYGAARTGGPAYGGVVFESTLPQGDVALEIATPRVRVRPGGPATIDLTARNSGAQPASVRLSSRLPAGLTYLSGPAGCAADLGLLTCPVGTLSPGSSALVRLVLGTGSRLGALSTSFSVAADGVFDVSPADDTATATVIVGSAQRDLDANGSSDVLWHHQGSGDLYAWLLDGTVATSGSYLTPSSLPDTRWQIAALADFDDDGDGDLLWRNQATGELYVWFLDGTVTTGGAHLSPPSLPDVRWQIRGAADLDGDGRPDLLWHHQQTGALYAWFMNGLVVKSAAYLSPPSVGDTQWQVRALADLDGDGRPDLLWHHQGTGELYGWFLDGIITRDASYLTPSRFADTRWKIVQASDFDQDGQVDLLWHHQATGELYVWFLDHKVVKGGAYLTPSAFADVSWKVVPR